MFDFLSYVNSDYSAVACKLYFLYDVLEVLSFYHLLQALILLPSSVSINISTISHKLYLRAFS